MPSGIDLFLSDLFPKGKPMSLHPSWPSSARAFWLFAAIFALALTLPALAEDKPTEDTDKEAANQKVLAELINTRISVDFNQTAFDVALKDIVNELPNTVVKIDPVIYKLSGLDRQADISIRLTNMPFRAIFNTLLMAAQQNGGQGRWDRPLKPVWKLEPNVKTKDGKTVNLLIYTFEDRETRVYDIRDLLVPSQDDWTQPEWSKEKKAEFRKMLVEQILTLIKTTAAYPSHWTDKYEKLGLNGSISELNGNLVIKTTPTTHTEIASLIDQLRAVRGYTIRFEARLMLLDAKTWQAVVTEHLPNPAVHEKGLKLPPREDSEKANGMSNISSGIVAGAVLNKEQFKALNDAVSNAQGKNLVLPLPPMNQYNGHRSYQLSASQAAYVSGVARTEEGKQPEPQIQIANTGYVWIAESTISSDRKYVTTTTRLRTAAKNGPMVRVNRGNGQQIEIPQLDMADLKTTTSIPDDNWLVLIGPSIQGTLETVSGLKDKQEIKDPAGYEDTRRVVLMYKPTILKDGQPVALGKEKTGREKIIEAPEQAK